MSIGLMGVFRGRNLLLGLIWISSGAVVFAQKATFRPTGNAITAEKIAARNQKLKRDIHKEVKKQRNHHALKDKAKFNSMGKVLAPRHYGHNSQTNKLIAHYKGGTIRMAKPNGVQGNWQKGVSSPIRALYSKAVLRKSMADNRMAAYKTKKKKARYDKDETEWMTAPVRPLPEIDKKKKKDNTVSPTDEEQN
ncbi:MAG TPA: hypothetical protein DCM08_04815 [Microscillaceae bacterium]|jgi:hypothetical protein|nr:hypothetical protein [Microscillaceae bacterium]